MKNIIIAIAFLFSISVLAYVSADGPGIHNRYGEVEISKYERHNATYAIMNFYTTSNPTYLNLSTTSFQTLTPFAVAESSDNMSTSAANGTVTLGTGAAGLYRIIMRMSIKATEASTIYFRTVKNDSTVVNKTFQRMSQGPDHYVESAVYVNLSSAGAVATAQCCTSTACAACTNIPGTLRQADGQTYHVNEGNGTAPAWVATFTVNRDIGEPQDVHFDNTAYAGSAGHNVKAYAYNYTFGRYTGLTISSDDFPDTGLATLPGSPQSYYGRAFTFPTKGHDYVLNGQVKVRLSHIQSGTSAHAFEIDKLYVDDRLDSDYIQHTEYIRLADGDSIKIMVGSDTPGTTFLRYVTGLKVERIGR